MRYGLCASLIMALSCATPVTAQLLALPAAGTSAASGTHYQGGKGATTTIAVTKPVASRADLFISDVQWLAPQPLHDESGFLSAVSGLGAAAARGATLVPRLFVNAMTSTSGPQQQSSVSQGVVVSPVMRVTVRNNGTQRWASTGTVHVSIYPGQPEDGLKSSDFANLMKQSKSLVQLSPLPLGSGTWVNNGTYLTSVGQIAGSIAPDGQTADVQVAFLNGISHPKDHLARYRFRLLVDKYYTASVSLTAAGDDTSSNNAVDYVFRLAPNGGIAEGRLVKRLTTGGATVTTNASESSGVTVKKK